MKRSMNSLEAIAIAVNSGFGRLQARKKNRKLKPAAAACRAAEVVIRSVIGPTSGQIALGKDNENGIAGFAEEITPRASWLMAKAVRTADRRRRSRR